MTRRSAADDRLEVRPEPHPRAGDGDPPGARELIIRVDRRRSVWSLVGLVLVVLSLVLVSRSCGWSPGFSNPFGERTTDRSQPVVLKSIQELSRYEAAAGNFQVVIDLEQDAKFIPSPIFGQRTLFVAAGTVDAYVDFAGLDDGAVSVSSDRTSVEVTLPRPGLEKPNLDQDKSYVFAQHRGIVNRFQSFFGDDSNRLQQLYQLAERKLADAAKESGLGQHAERNTRVMLQGLFTSLGFRTVEITFTSP